MTAAMKLTYRRRDNALETEHMECDNYKCDIHPVTGHVTLHMYESHGPGSRLKAVVSGVSDFYVTHA